MESSSAFWSTAVQVIPVFAIALLLESRAIAKGYLAPDEFRSSRAARTALAITVTICLVLLFLAFSFALNGLVSSVPLDHWTTYFVYMALSLVGAWAVLAPIANFALAVANDVLIEMLRKFPWSANSRTRRELSKRVHRMETGILNLRSQAMSRWMDLSESLVTLYQIERIVPTSGTDSAEGRQLIDQGFRLTQEAIAEAAELSQMIREVESGLQEVRTEMQSAGLSEEEMSEALRRLERQLTALA